MSLADLVDRYCSDDDDAKYDVLDGVADFELSAAARYGLHEECAGERAEDGAAAAAQAGAADHRGCDHFQFQADAGGRISDVELGELIDAGQANEKAA